MTPVNELMKLCMENRQTILDSSVWIAYLDKEDSQHTKAEQLLEGVHPSTVFVTEYILLEVTSVLKQKGQYQKAKDFIQKAYGIRYIPSVTHHEQTCRLFIETNDTHLSFVDMSLVHLSQYYTIMTFDRQLQRYL